MKDELGSSMFFNLPQPPDEPRLEIGQNGRELRGKDEEEKKKKLIWANFTDPRLRRWSRPSVSPLLLSKAAQTFTKRKKVSSFGRGQ